MLTGKERPFSSRRSSSSKNARQARSAFFLQVAHVNPRRTLVPANVVEQVPLFLQKMFRKAPRVTGRPSGFFKEQQGSPPRPEKAGRLGHQFAEKFFFRAGKIKGGSPPRRPGAALPVAACGA